MPQVAKPFAYRGHWCSKVNGKLTRLLPLDKPITDARKVLERLRSAEPVQNSPLTVQQAYEAYKRAKSKAETTWKANGSNLARILVRFGNRPIASITSLDVDSIAPVLGLGARQAARAFWSWCALAGHVKSNVWKAIALPAPGGRKRVATDEEFKAILGKSHGVWRQVFIFLRSAGCRPQDVYQMRWDWIEGRFIKIPTDCHKTGRKTGEARIVYLPSSLVKLLAWRKVRSTSEFVFPNMDKDKIAYQFGMACNRAGIDQQTHKTGEPLVPYSLRHTRATEIANDNSIPLHHKMKIMGHKKLKTFLHYCHAEDSEALQHLA